MAKKSRLVGAADAGVKAMRKVKTAVGAMSRALSSSRPPPPEESRTPDTASVLFEVVAPTEFGDAVWVVGNHETLGAWDPARGVPLDPATYPTWSGRVLVPAAEAVEYKYVRKRGDGSFAWESMMGNRTLTTPAPGAELSTHDEVAWS